MFRSLNCSKYEYIEYLLEITIYVLKFLKIVFKKCAHFLVHEYFFK